MAVVRTDFTGTTQATNAPEVLAYLQANATGYFDTITSDANGNVECKIGEVTVLKLAFENGVSSIAKLVNGTELEAYYSGDRFTYAIKAANGIYLNSYDYGHIFITKSNKNTTAICWEPKTSSGSYSYICADFTHSTSFYTFAQDSWSDIQGLVTKQAPITSLTPLVCGSGCYLPHVFAATFSEYPFVKGIFSINGVQHVSDGAVMLSDGT